MLQIKYRAESNIVRRLLDESGIRDKAFKFLLRMKKDLSPVPDIGADDCQYALNYYGGSVLGNKEDGYFTKYEIIVWYPYLSKREGGVCRCLGDVSTTISILKRGEQSGCGLKLANSDYEFITGLMRVEYKRAMMEYCRSIGCTWDCPVVRALSNKATE
jgi:hypothetical protein